MSNNEMHGDVQSAIFITYAKRLTAGELSPEDQKEVSKIMDSTAIAFGEMEETIAQQEFEITVLHSFLEKMQLSRKYLDYLKSKL